MAKRHLIIRVLIPLVILAVSIAGGTWLITNPEKARKGHMQESLAPLVKTATITPARYNVPVEALGQVIPATETVLKPQVSGEILSTAEEFIPGGRLSKGEVAVTINPVDYELAVKKQEALLEQAEADYKLELGRQDIAKDELEILARTTGRKLDNTDLALRLPQLAQAKAEIEKARADLAVALLNLERTSVKAPFNALITERSATLGDKVQPQDTLAMLVSTDEYWIEISLPVSDLKWLSIPNGSKTGGNKALVSMQDGRGTREGNLLKITGTVNPQSRFADILVRVPDPLLLEKQGETELPLILGDYVKVVFEGKTLENAFKLPVSWLRPDNTVWVHDDGKLISRKVTIAYEDREHVYITEGLSAKDEIITSDISVSVDGMKLRIKTEAPESVK